MSFFENWLESLTPEGRINQTCVREISPHAACSACIDICQPKALRLSSQKKILFDSTKCTACHECVLVCPNHAISGIPYNRQIENKTLRTTDSSIPQLKELLILHAVGIHTLTTDTELSNEWKRAVKEANECLLSLEQEPFEILTHYNKMQETVDRRQLFQRLRSDGLQYSKQFLPIKWRDHPELWHLNGHYPDFQLFQIEIDTNNCTACTICFKICPNQVFTVQVDSYEMNHANCTNCGLCADVCAPHAVTITQRLQKKTITYLPRYTHICACCKQNFESVNNLETKCMACRKYSNQQMNYTVRL